MTERAAFDPARFKEQERQGFNAVAQKYEAAMAVMSPVVERLIALAGLEEGQRVLDVATGPGMVARQAATLVKSDFLVGAEAAVAGQVLGVDIANDAIEVARGRARDEGLTNVEFMLDDAEALQLADAQFDRVLCSFGLMHFPAPDKAMAEMARVLKPGGRLIAAVWGEAENVPFIELALRVMTRNFPPPKVERPSMFRLGTLDALSSLAESAGLRVVEVAPMTAEVTVRDAADYWRLFLNVAGITTVALNKQPPEVRQKLVDDTAADLQAYYDSAAGVYRLPNTVMTLLAEKP